MTANSSENGKGRGVRVAYPDGADSARLDPRRAVELAGLDGTGVELVVGWVPEPRAWLDEGDLTGVTMMAGYACAPAIASGRLQYLPVRLGATARLISDRWRPDVAVVAGVRRGADLAFAGTVGWGPAAVRSATSVVVEIDEGAPDLGAPVIPGNIVATVSRDGGPSGPPTSRPADDVDRRIGRLVVSLLPDEPTMQFGPGGIGEGIVAALDRPIAIFSGLVTDAMAELDQRGLLSGPITAGYPWGGAPIVALARDGRLRLAPVEETHDITGIAAIPRFVGCNTALQVGLDGTVNVERVGGRLVAGIGGHADFCAGASRSVGGVSIIALRATDPKGRSTIVPVVETTSTQRSDVEVVVTEHGIADLRGVDDAERARRLTAIAAPQHREAISPR